MTDPLVAVVTGAAQGIGRATADRLTSNNWTVHRLDRDLPDDETRNTHHCDVTDIESLERVAASIGQTNAVVTAAGINLRPEDGPAQRLNLDALNKTLEVNLTGTMLTVRAFYPRIADSGAITTLGSTAALSAMPWADAYTATKGAVVALTRSWAADYSRYGIRANCVCPGATDTSMMEGILEQFDTSQQMQVPQQRFAYPDEIASVIEFTLSPQATYLSGAMIPVDGGATAQTAGLPFPRRRTRTL